MPTIDLERGVAPQERLLIFVVAYEAEQTLESVIARIPSTLFADPRLGVEVLVIDDASSDRTFEAGYTFATAHGRIPLTVLRNPSNLGYGGNQKLGYRYALDHGFDYVALIHGDGQYAPEELPRLLEPLRTGRADAVFGSRMMERGAARRGGMPLYKFVGNRILTTLQNWMVGLDLSEWHSGYRLYACDVLRQLPFEVNSDGFDFDTEIIIQLGRARRRICELSIPTFYGDEICRVNGVSYGAKILWTSLLSRIQELGLLYDRRFDLTQTNDQYRDKFDFASSHRLALDLVSPDDTLVILGSGPAALVLPFSEQAAHTTAVDQFVDSSLSATVDQAIEADLNRNGPALLELDRPATRVLALDIIEHLHSPEDFLRQIRESPALNRAELVLTTGNVAFGPVRLMLLLGLFNYGKTGILDRTHTRLFTFASLKRLFAEEGYDVKQVRGIPAPFPLALGRASILARVLLWLNQGMIRLSRGLFAYQILIVARPRPTVAHLLAAAVVHAEEEAARLLAPSPAA